MGTWRWRGGLLSESHSSSEVLKVVVLSLCRRAGAGRGERGDGGGRASERAAQGPPGKKHHCPKHALLSLKRYTRRAFPPSANMHERTHTHTQHTHTNSTLPAVSHAALLLPSTGSSAKDHPYRPTDILTYRPTDLRTYRPMDLWTPAAMLICLLCEGLWRSGNPLSYLAVLGRGRRGLGSPRSARGSGA